MAFLDKLSDIAKGISDKTGDAIETNKLNSKISSESKEIDKSMKKIGEFYYEKYKSGEQLADEMIEIFAKIDAHNLAIKEAQTEINRIKALNEVVESNETVAPITGTNITCLKCGTVNDSSKKFCSGCGTKIEIIVPQEKICSVCGAKISEGLKFCNECGNKVE